jgi:predicted  nucleic acid-binding Zn-ribbon protein
MSRERLESIERLQTVDLELDAVAAARAAGPGLKGDREAEVERLRAAADTARGAVADQERLRAQAARQFDEEREKVKAWETRLPALKHQREFAALSREIEAARRAHAAAEEQMKAADAVLPGLKQALAQRESALSEAQELLAAVAARLVGEESALIERHTELEGLRAEAVSRADAELVRKYELARKKGKGRALAQVRGGVCSGCQRRLPPQLALQLHAGAVESCPGCGRLLTVAPPSVSPQA